MNLFYNVGISLYRGAAHIAALRSPKVKRMLSGQRETFERIRKFRRELAPDGFDVWIHAASLGEFEQARPLIDRLLKVRPDTSILLSFFSPSGYQVRYNYNPRVAVVYLPFDLPTLVDRFIKEAAPKMAIFVKYEFWGNYLETLHKRAVPTYIISAIFRQEQIFFKPWGGMFRKMLNYFDGIYVQDDNSAKMLASIGINKVKVAGDTRFDRVVEIKNNGCKLPEIEAFLHSSEGNVRHTVVVGSSWERDEDVYIPWAVSNDNCKFIIAPREFNNERLAILANRLGKDSVLLFSTLRRQYEQDPQAASEQAQAKRFLIIDCFGLLSSLYRYADIAYIGGGFGVGIHNINEAAVYGIPVIFGPNHHKFKEARDLIACGGAYSINGSADYQQVINNLLSDSERLEKSGRAANEYINSHIGATSHILLDLFGIEADNN